MVTFVLVHGSFHGGWCWEKVEPRLGAAGHDVYTPTLTGVGERSHLVHPRVGLDLHVQDVSQVFEYEGLADVVLVGHSYGGLVITGVAEGHADRIAHLVYLDGFLPEHGQSAFDVVEGSRERWTETAESEGNGWLYPPPDPAESYEIADPDDLAMLRERLAPMPLLTHSESLRAPGDRAKALPRTYIACERYETFRPTARKARAEGLDYYELDTGHDAMISAPEELSSILTAVAETVD